MKKWLFFLVFMLVGITAQAQYRALSVSATNGIGLTDNTTFHSASMNFHYGFESDWYLSNWSGISYDADNPYQRWIASDITANKWLDNRNLFSVGAGIQYRHEMRSNLNDFYLVIRITKTFRFD